MITKQPIIRNSTTDLVDFKSWSNTEGVVTVAMDNNARQPSSISLKKTKMNLRTRENKKKYYMLGGNNNWQGYNLSLFPHSIALETASGGSIHCIIPESSSRRWCSCICTLSRSLNKLLKWLMKDRYRRNHITIIT